MSAAARAARARAILGGLMSPAVLVLAIGASAGAPVAAAGEVTFEAPTASSVLGQSLTFSVGFRSATTPTRVELLRHLPRTEGDFVEEAQVTPAGAGRYTVTVVDRGPTLPNTTTLYRFRVTTPDGVATSGEGSLTVTDDRFQWRVREGTLIRLHWYEGDDAFADRALKVGEDGIRRAMDLLGVTETDPVDFFIYADETSFRDVLGPGTRENVGGRSVSSIRTLFALIRPSEIGSDWIESVIPHELTHLVFGTASENPYHFPPKWLNEGLSVYLEPGGYSADWRARVESAGRNGSLIPLDGLVLQFPADRDGFFLGYAESVSAVDFFVRRYGQDTLVKLIRSYAQGVSDDDAFRAATGADVRAFGAAWIAEMNGRAAPAYGPQPAPPGPLPSDWTAPSPPPGASAAPGASGSPDASASRGPEASGAPGASPAPSTPTAGSDEGRRDGALPLVLVLAAAGVLSLVAGVVLIRRSGAGR